MVVLEEIGHAVLKKDDSLDQSLDIELLHYLLLALGDEAGIGPIGFLSDAGQEVIKVVLEEGTDVHAEALHID